MVRSIIVGSPATLARPLRDRPGRGRRLGLRPQGGGARREVRAPRRAETRAAQSARKFQGRPDLPCGRSPPQKATARSHPIERHSRRVALGGQASPLLPGRGLPIEELAEEQRLRGPPGRRRAPPSPSAAGAIAALVSGWARGSGPGRQRRCRAPRRRPHRPPRRGSRRRPAPRGWCVARGAWRRAARHRGRRRS